LLGIIMTAQPHVLAKSPTSCTDAELADFAALVLVGGEVSPHGLEGRVRSAERVAFLREDTCLISVAGLKRPSDNHRTEVALASGVSLPVPEFPFELGWVFLLPSARKRHLSLPLCQPLVEAVAAQGVFATSKAGNAAMHSTLRKLGFHSAGQPYLSSRGNYQLQVFLRHASQQAVPGDAPTSGASRK